jgi:hypothetical protein
MTSPKLKLEHEPSSSLDRWVDDARRLRPMLDAERGALWSRIVESRATRSPSPRRWLVACGAVALALAALPLAAPNGLLRDGPPPAEAGPAQAGPAQAVAAPSAAQSAPALSAAPAAASGSAGDAPAAPSRAEPVMRRPERLVSLGNRGELVLDADADLRLPTPFDPTARRPLSIRLDRGSVRASVATRAPDEPFSIVTPHVSVVVVGTRFSVSVEAARTTVSVEEGRVRVDQAGHTVLLDAGQSIRSNDARFQGERELDPVEAPPAAPTSRAPTSRAPTSRTQTSRAPKSRAPVAARAEFCEGDSVTRRTCLLRASQGTGLTAENALFALALLERDELADRGAALARLDEYERRHPRGVLAPEVVLARVETLLGDGRPEAARAAAAEHARRFPDDLATSRRLAALIDAYRPAGPAR